ncbi:MAG: hypothetical protein JNK82_33485 [Myxococcaceae bacterium]|nr:hypothetical protein [Myxococcaceae bacterium]
MVLAACRGEWHFTDDAGGAPVCPIAACLAPLVCSAALNRCVECTSDDSCPAQQPRCEVARGRCVECLASSDCGAGRVCEREATHVCVPTCTDDSDCPGVPCRDVDVGRVCDACASPVWCPGTAGTPRCEEHRRACVACTEDDHCTGALGQCDRRVGACVECVDSRDCAAGSFCVGSVCRAR